MPKKPDEESTQRTKKGYEIPVPKKVDVLRNLEKIAKRGTVSYRVKIGGRVIGPEFEREQDAHAWVAEARPGETYSIAETRG